MGANISLHLFVQNFSSVAIYSANLDLFGAYGLGGGQMKKNAYDLRSLARRLPLKVAPGSYRDNISCIPSISKPPSEWFVPHRRKCSFVRIEDAFTSSLIAAPTSSS